MKAVRLFLAALLFTLAFPVAAFAQDNGDDGDVIDPGTDLGMWSLLVGAVLPALVAFVMRQDWSRTVKAIVGLIASIIAGAVTTWLTEEDSLFDQGMAHAILLVAVASWASYNAFWKPTGAAPKISQESPLT